MGYIQDLINLYTEERPAEIMCDKSNKNHVTKQKELQVGEFLIVSLDRGETVDDCRPSTMNLIVDGEEFVLVSFTASTVLLAIAVV